MSEDWVKIEVDGEQLEARKGAMLIEVTDAARIKIPRFCYHPKLSVAANCRMCLVEVERAPKPLPACATPVMDGMKVWTRSAKALEAQQGTMEFLLINHPLDCPICDQGGECELQDVAMGYGDSVSRFVERKRAVADKDIGPLIATGMDRCIHCTRCIRFGEEIAGLRELGATGRGEHMEIGTYIHKSMASELSGNVIDICPVGALMAKPSYNTGRSWEYIQHAAVSPHDSVGSNLFIHTIRGKVMRVVPQDNEEINEAWLSDRDRFSYEGIYASDRVLKPWLKTHGDSEWSEALAAASEQIKTILSKYGAESVGVLIAPNATVEEMYLAQKLARGLGISNIDHRLRQADFSDDAAAPVFPWLGQSLVELEKNDAMLLIGSNVRMEQPLAGHRIRKAALQGAKVMFVNPRAFDFRFPVAATINTDPHAMLQALASIAKALVQAGKNADAAADLQKLIDKAKVTEQTQGIADALLEGQTTSVLLGNLAIAHPAYSTLRALAGFIAQASGAALGYLPDASNSVGGCLSGALPQRGPGGQAVDNPGLNARAMLEQPRKAYLLIGAIEPELDCWDSVAALNALQQAECVIALTPFSGKLKDYADVILPIATFAETSGTSINAEGRWQRFQGACKPLGEARPGWKVLRVLGNSLQLDGFDYLDSPQIAAEVWSVCRDLQPDNKTVFDGALATGLEAEIWRLADVPIYSVDALVRRADALQQTPLAQPAQIRINSQTAQKLGLHNAAQAKAKQSNGEIVLPLVLDDSIPDACVWIAAGLTETAQLGPMIGPIELGAA
ncbi:MAG: NADH-quinone oxidoreductase subunit G [Candidatus Competibacteraceae bacterium]|nr:NADH-quinone oxidoreductase subunit G [Candidatus Competibacteraceae bacterium]MCB1815610.1 NADH-quinone oxidoreductase subunit G [Candidatus Competibacteraceae bacterium]